MNMAGKMTAIFLGTFLIASLSFCAAVQAKETAAQRYITTIKVWRHGETGANHKKLLSGGGNDDKEGITALNPEGVAQAQKLGQLVLDRGELDVVYTSDLNRARDTAKAVLEVFEHHGKHVPVIESMQLREILHGEKFELSPSSIRDAAAEKGLRKILLSDKENGAPVTDIYRLWKFHPLATADDIVPEEEVDVEAYLKRGETRPETPFQLWKRVHREFIRIAKENPGKTIGVSTHGAVLAVLIDGLSKQKKVSYLVPYYMSKELKDGDTVLLPTGTRVKNCAFFVFKFDSRTGTLERIDEE